MNINDNTANVSLSGTSYFLKGFSLIRTKGIKRFVFVPLTVNFLLFAVAFYFLFTRLDHYITQLIEQLPEMFKWVDYLIWPIAVVLVLVTSSFIFSAIANWIAAPFNGLLAEKLEAKLTGDEIPGTLSDAFKDSPRTLKREWVKLRYYIPRALAFLVVFWLLPVFGQIIWFLFSAWMMAIQYCDTLLTTIKSTST